MLFAGVPTYALSTQLFAGYCLSRQGRGSHMCESKLSLPTALNLSHHCCALRSISLRPTVDPPYPSCPGAGPVCQTRVPYITIMRVHMHTDSQGSQTNICVVLFATRVFSNAVVYLPYAYAFNTCSPVQQS